MTLFEPPWIRPVLAENCALFQVLMVTDSHFCHTDFTLLSRYSAGHMLKVIVIEKDALQVIDDLIDGPVGSIPNLPVVGSSGCVDSDQ